MRLNSWVGLAALARTHALGALVTRRIGASRSVHSGRPSGSLITGKSGTNPLRGSNPALPAAQQGGLDEGMAWNPDPRIVSRSTFDRPGRVPGGRPDRGPNGERALASHVHG